MKIRQQLKKKTQINKKGRTDVRLSLITHKGETMNTNYNHYLDPEYFTKKEAQKKEIKYMGYFTGFALVCQIVIENLLSKIIELTGMTEKYLSDGVFQNCVDIIIVSIGMLVPFMIVGKKMKETSGEREPVALGKPTSPLTFILAVVAGIGLCMFANIITTYFTLFVGFFGFELYSPDIPMPGGAVGVLTGLMRIVIVAALTEELALRGYIMGNLRKYGDKFAILASSVVFALMHGNLVQAPFALIAGFGLGYLSVKTGTIWTGIAIHAANNFISMAVSYAIDILPEDTVNIIYAFILYGFMVFGMVSLWLLKSSDKLLSLRKDYLNTSVKEKMKFFFINPAMIPPIAYMLYITARFIGFNLE